MAKRIIISHVKGYVNQQPFECFIRHGSGNLQQSYCAAFFAVTGETFSEKPREYHVQLLGKVMGFQFTEPRMRAVLEITPVGVDYE